MKSRLLLALFFVLYSGMYMSQSPIEAQSTSNPLPPIWMDWSNDGTKLVTVNSQGLTVYDSNWIPTNFRAFPSDINYEVSPPHFSPDGTKILVNKEIWDASTLQTLLTISADVWIYSPQWSRDRTSIAFRNWSSRSTSIYSAEDGTLMRQFSSGSWQTGYEYGPTWSPNNLYFATTGGRSTVVMLDAVTGADIARYPLVDKDIGRLVWSPDNTRLALIASSRVPVGTSGSYPQEGGSNQAVLYSVVVLNVSDGQVITTITNLRDVIREVAWSPDGTQIAGYDTFRRLYIWDANSGILLDNYLTPPYLTNFLKYSAYGGRLVVGFEIGRTLEKRNDNPLIPTSLFIQPVFGESVQFVVPAASPDRLLDILAQCVTDQETRTIGNGFIATGQYKTFAEWISQLPSSIMPTACAADLQLITQALIADFSLTDTATSNQH